MCRVAGEVSDPGPRLVCREGRAVHPVGRASREFVDGESVSAKRQGHVRTRWIGEYTVRLVMHRMPRWIAGLLLIGTLEAGCASPIRPRVGTPPAVPRAEAMLAAAVPCVSTQHGCIALNEDVRPETLQQTICLPGYTKSVRPSSRYSNGVKAKLLHDEGLDSTHAFRYELDHLVPLALGGHPRKLSNLALQARGGEQGAERKDILERRLQVLVCRGELALGDAQACIAEDWEACARQYAPR